MQDRTWGFDLNLPLSPPFLNLVITDGRKMTQSAKVNGPWVTIAITILRLYSADALYGLLFSQNVNTFKTRLKYENQF